MVSRVAVTGATGMVGSHVVKHLLKSDYNVIATIRGSSDIRALSALEPAENLVLKQVDLSSPKTLEQAFQDADVVIHAAGAVNPLSRRKQVYQINVEGTRNAIAAAQRCAVKQFIHISSLSVITGRHDQYDVSEDAPLRYSGEPYGDSKSEAEKLLMSFKSSSPNFNITCLRPGFIYGPGEKAWLPRLINSLRTGKAVLIDGGAKETNVIYVQNLCRAIELSILNPAAYGQTYNLTDGQHISKKMLFDTICLRLGYPPITRVVPGPVAWTACEFVSSILPMLPLALRRKLTRYSRAAFRLAGLNQGFNISKAQRELKYTDTISFYQGMSDTLKEFSLISSQRQETLDAGALFEDLYNLHGSEVLAVMEEGTQA